MDLPPCLFCRRPVRSVYVPDYGTSWVHEDGYAECKPRYATPDFINQT